MSTIQLLLDAIKLAFTAFIEQANTTFSLLVLQRESLVFGGIASPKLSLIVTTELLEL